MTVQVVFIRSRGGYNWAFRHASGMILTFPERIKTAEIINSNQYNQDA